MPQTTNSPYVDKINFIIFHSDEWEEKKMGYISSFDLLLLKILLFHKKKNTRIDTIFVKFIWKQNIINSKRLPNENQFWKYSIPFYQSIYRILTWIIPFWQIVDSCCLSLHEQKLSLRLLLYHLYIICQLSNHAILLWKVYLLLNQWGIYFEWRDLIIALQTVISHVIDECK